MIINIARLWPVAEVIGTAELPEYQVDDFNSTLYIPLPRWAELHQVANQIYSLVQNSQRSFDCIILKAHKFEAEQLLSILGSKKLVPDIADRFENGPIWLLFWNVDESRYNLKRLNYTSIQGDRVEPSEANDLEYEEGLIESLRQAEFTSWTWEPGALLPKVSECHYEGPNNSHYNSFLRVGVAIHSLEILDHVTFWLLPFLLKGSDLPVLLLDSGAILSIGLNVERYLKECLYIDPEDRIFLECLQSYKEEIDQLMRRLESVRTQNSENSVICIIMSVSSSNRLANRLRTGCESNGWDAIEVVSLYACSGYSGNSDAEGNSMSYSTRSVNNGITQSGMPIATVPSEPRVGAVLCTLHEDFRRYDDHTVCPACLSSTPSPLIQIQPSTYLLEATAFVTEKALRNDHAEYANKFFSRYSGEEFLSVHRDQHNQARHHMIHIDVQQISKVEAFQTELKQKVSELKGPVDVVLSPSHDAATALSHVVSQYLHVPLIVCDQYDLSKLTWDQKAQIKGRQVLLVDDVVITGSRLRSYRKFLRELHIVPSTLRLLVGVARPDTIQHLGGIKDMVHGKENFISVERLFLPNWDAAECPWCIERKLLDESIPSEEKILASDEMRLRYKELGNTGIGLKSHLFMHWSSRAACDMHFELGPDSIFIGKDENPLCQVELYVGVASAIQVMRNFGELNERFTTPVARVLDPAKSTINRFYDSIITASILRATRRSDLRSTKTDPELSNNIKILMDDPSSHEYRSEMLFAITRGLLPESVDHSSISSALADGELGVTSFLKTIIN